MKKKMLINLIILIILSIIKSIPVCKEEVNFCSKCNPVTKLCVKCTKDIYTPDNNGGCTYARKCTFGNNYCSECNEEGNLCKICEEDYFPDQNGGCSYTDTCEISDRGICLECQKDFILIGIDDYFTNGVRVCKWKDSEDLKNCERINTSNGACIECKEGYHLNTGDRKCTLIENCYHSSFGICQKCKEGFYLDKREQKCIRQEGIFLNCKESLDNKTCSSCDDNYFLSEDGKCTSVNYCSKTNEYGKCRKCIEGYYLTNYENACSIDKNCFSGDRYFGICYSCKGDYYLDLKDRKCKSNQEDNEYKYCEEIDEDGLCQKCVYDYQLAEDHKCCKSQYCAESENQICIECKDNYHLGIDNLCVNKENCIRSDYLTAQCIECKDDYYYDRFNEECKPSDSNFTNCKFSNSNGDTCQECKDDYYLNQIDHKCYSNKEEGDFYKCALSTPSGEHCMICIENYYLGEIDNKCTTIEGCQISIDENKCKQCNDYYYCLDEKTGKCEENDIIKSEDKKFYYRCNKTNEEGTACKTCLFDYILNENGLCIDIENCEEEKEGVCQKCKDNGMYYYCLNKDFGCIEMFNGEGCLECNNLFDLDMCTKCMDGYELDYNGKCIEI